MELDDLKIAWTELDRRIASVEYVVRADRQARTFSSVRRVLRLLGMRQAVQVVAGIFMIAIVAPYWIAHHGVPHLLIAGLSLHLYGVLAVCAAVVQLLVIGRTYYGASRHVSEAHGRAAAAAHRLRAGNGAAVVRAVDSAAGRRCGPLARRGSLPADAGLDARQRRARVCRDGGLRLVARRMAAVRANPDRGGCSG